MAKAETCWTDFPNAGFSVKPDRRLTKAGLWQGSNRQLLRRFPKVELLTCQGGSWYYLGTYVVAANDTLSADDLKVLPQEIRSCHSSLTMLRNNYRLAMS